MKIVIDIDNESYEHIKTYKNEDVLPMGWYAISHGKPLIMSNCISREAAIDLLKNIDTIVSPISDDVLLIDKAEAIEKLMFLPPEQPKSDVPDINVGSKNCILNKIRAEIESCLEDEEPHLCDYRYYINLGLDMALDIIDKYNLESEE